MTKQRFFITYLFIFLLVLAGLILFAFREQVASGLMPDSFNYPTTNTTPVAGEGVISLDVLRDARVKALQNKVEWFDYNDLNKSQEIILKNTPPLMVPGETSTSAPRQISPTKVRVGNSNPFLAPTGR